MARDGRKLMFSRDKGTLPEQLRKLEERPRELTHIPTFERKTTLKSSNGQNHGNLNLKKKKL
jgi:hypothetical protein